MTLDSSRETVAILYDIENAPFEMLDYTLGKARRYQPCRTIVVSDWNARPEQKRWEKLLRRPGFTFRQIDRTFDGKNSLDYALFDSARLLYAEGVRRFFIITTDSDFVKIAEALNAGDTPSYIIGVGTKQASETLRNAYDEFFCYSPESRSKAKDEGGESMKKEKPEKARTPHGKERQPLSPEARQPRQEDAAKDKELPRRAAKTLRKGDASPAGKRAAKEMGALAVHLPRTLQAELHQRQQQEGVSMDELITYLLMRGMSR